VKPGDVAQLLVEDNPWWRDRERWASRDVQLREATRSGLDYAPPVLVDVPRGSLVQLRGPRRVGKSVALKRYAEQILMGSVEPRSVIHAAVDGWKASDLRSLVQTGKRMVPSATEHRWWLIDEISSVEGWAAVIKHLRDNDPEFSDDTVVLTGSSSKDLVDAGSQLAGRRGPVSRPDRTLLPMGFRTFADLMFTTRGLVAPGTDQLMPHELHEPLAARVYSQLLPWLNDLLGWWELYLLIGGFPQSVAAHVAGDDNDALAQALFDVVHRDAFAGATLSETGTTALLSRLCENLCSPVNVSSVARDIGMNNETVARRLHDLIGAYLLLPVHQNDDMRPRLQAQSKQYFIDPLMARLAHLRNARHRPPDLTRLTEQQLAVAIARRLEHRSPGTYAAVTGSSTPGRLPRRRSTSSGRTSSRSPSKASTPAQGAGSARPSPSTPASGVACSPPGPCWTHHLLRASRGPYRPASWPTAWIPDPRVFAGICRRHSKTWITTVRDRTWPRLAPTEGLRASGSLAPCPILVPTTQVPGL
jgi:predicted AAA+ superfamily ATPase